MCFFLMSQGSFSPKIRFLGQKVCSLARTQTDRRESENRGHPFRVSGFFKFSFNLSSRSGPIRKQNHWKAYNTWTYSFGCVIATPFCYLPTLAYFNHLLNRKVRCMHSHIFPLLYNLKDFFLWICLKRKIHDKLIYR